MDKELERAYDALKQADAAGNKEDAQQIADYIRSLEAQQNVPKGGASVSGISNEELVNKLTPTIGGAIAGQVAGPVINRGYEAAAAKPAQMPPTRAPSAGGTPYNPRGMTVEQSVQNWENYSQAQNEAAKRVRRESELHKKYPGFTRAQPPTPPPAPPTGMAKVSQAIPESVKTAGRFIGGATQSGVAPYVGRSLAGAAAGFQGADAYNRFQQGDYLGAGISGAGALGAGAAFLPNPVTRVGGTALSIGAESLNAYIDYLKKKRSQPQQEQEPQSEQAMPVPMAQGGLVGGLDATYNMPLPGGASVGLSNMQQPQMNPMMPKSGLSYFKEGGSTTPAWQRKEGKSPSGGLNAVGRASYKRETGGELKAPQPEGGSRKKSFCARMGGMKKKLTSSKTANDPDSRINKALRKWKC